MLRYPESWEMETPIVDFVKEYSGVGPVRFHMPGHKGNNQFLGIEHLDITEIEGADDLWHDSSDGIIAKSEANASSLFGCPTFYSTEGSSLCIRAMLFMIKKWSAINGEKPFILAGRNAHKTFINTAALLDIKVQYLYGNDNSYMSCNISKEQLLEAIGSSDERISAVYITSPDYLGNIADIESLSKVCRDNKILLLVDNAHGAYLKFDSEYADKNAFPIDAGAAMCCDSAHKTLPVLTGGAYLHISREIDEFFITNAKASMALFASTSPSYLILQSLDYCNKYIDESIREDLSAINNNVKAVKARLEDIGYHFVGNELLKLSFDIKEYGYTGSDFAKRLRDSNIYVEHADDDYVVLLISPFNTQDELDRLFDAAAAIPRLEAIPKLYDYPALDNKQAELTPLEAMMSDSELVRAEDSLGRILSAPALSCPPCVAHYLAGERIDTIPKGCDYVQVIKEKKCH